MGPAGRASRSASSTSSSVRRRGTNTPGSTATRRPWNCAQPSTCSSGRPSTRCRAIASSSPGRGCRLEQQGRLLLGEHAPGGAQPRDEPADVRVVGRRRHDPPAGPTTGVGRVYPRTVRVSTSKPRGGVEGGLGRVGLARRGVGEQAGDLAEVQPAGGLPEQPGRDAQAAPARLDVQVADVGPAAGAPGARRLVPALHVDEPDPLLADHRRQPGTAGADGPPHRRSPRPVVRRGAAGRRPGPPGGSRSGRRPSRAPDR